MNTQATTTTSVQLSVTVDAPVDRAFSVFTADIGSWWPAEHHILQAELAEMVFEPREGGRIYDRGVDDSTCQFSRVLAYEPPTRVVFTWDINTQWQIETDASRTSEIEVRFIAETPSRTRVELEHRHLERHGDGWEKMREAVNSPDGWPLTLGNFTARMKR